MAHKVYFVGSGPGNAKYITVMGKELLEQADLVVYAGSLVNRKCLIIQRERKWTAMDSPWMKRTS